VLPPLDPSTGSLPLGRYVCTAAEIEEMFVTGEVFFDSISRPQIWSDWNEALAVLQSAVTVHAVWIGGSFTTAKVDPGDIDVTYVVSASQIRGLGQEELKVVGIFNTKDAVKQQLGLNVDTFLLPWECVTSPVDPGSDGLQDLYYWIRGHWDDWWQRERQGPKEAPPEPADAVLRRGYLEVPVSDYLT
jgi:hypothetical protein